MPVLIGELEKITGSPSSVTQVMVRAHTTRITGAALTTDELVPIPVDRQGRFEVSLRPGKAVLVLVHGGRVGEGERFPMLVEEGLGTITSAIKLASDRFDDYELDELERTAADMLSSLDKSLVAATRAEAAHEGAKEAHSGAKSAQIQAEQARDKAGEHLGGTEKAATNAAAIVKDADEKLSGYVSDTKKHSESAKTSASESAKSESSAAADATRAESSRVAVVAAHQEVIPLADQVRTDATATAAHRDHVDGQVDAIDTAFTESVPPYLQPDAPSGLRASYFTVVEAPLTPYRFGAKPPESGSDNTSALRKMFEAAASSSSQNSDVRIPPGRWEFHNSDGKGPLPLSTGLKVTGSGSGKSRLNPRSTGGVALFRNDSHVKSVDFRDLNITTLSGAGNIIESGGVDRATFENVFFVQQLSGFSIWQQSKGDMVQVVFTSCEFQAATTSRPWFDLVSPQGGFNSNTFSACRFNGLNNTKAPVFRIEETGYGAQVNDWAFRDIILEQTTGGFLHVSGAANWILDNVQSWDSTVPHEADLMRFDRSDGIARPNNLTFRNVCRHGESLAPGVHDVNILDGAPAGGVATFINCNPTPYNTNSVINSPPDRTAFIGTRGYSAAVASGPGSPEGVVTGTVGDLYTRTDGGPGSTLYVKESGTGTAIGWVAK